MRGTHVNNQLQTLQHTTPILRPPPKYPLRQIRIRPNRIPITIQPNKKMPQQQAGITRRDAHHDIQDRTGRIADLGEREGRVEGPEDVGGDEVEDGGPGGDAEGATGVQELFFVGCEDRCAVVFLTEAVMI